MLLLYNTPTAHVHHNVNDKLESSFLICTVARCNKGFHVCMQFTSPWCFVFIQMASGHALVMCVIYIQQWNKLNMVWCSKQAGEFTVIPMCFHITCVTFMFEITISIYTILYKCIYYLAGLID